MGPRSVDYNQLAAEYDSRYAVNQLAGIAEALVELVRTARTRRVLEVGCGTGHWLRELQPHVPLLCGADSSRAMLDGARAKLPRMPLVLAPANGLPFAAGSFDLIFCVNAIHHFSDARAFIEDAGRLLVDQGVLAVIGIDPRLIRRRYIYDYFEGGRDLDLRRFPAVGDVVNWMAAAGFSRIEYRNVERYERVFRGRAVFSDPFLNRKSNSFMAMLSDVEYQRGLRGMEAAIAEAESEGREAEFEYHLSFPMIAGWRHDGPPFS